jgi:hypothetical protein
MRLNSKEVIRMKSTVKKEITKTELIVHMDVELENLRKSLWKTLHQFDNTVTYADKSMVLGIVQYELLHHADEHGDE